MYTTPKYAYFSSKAKAQQIELTCFSDDETDITENCKLDLINPNKDLTIVKNIIKAGKNPKASINKISVLYKRGDVVEQDYVMLYVE